MNKLDSMIGLCQKAGKIASGSFLTIDAIKKKKVYLVILSEDASKNTKKRINNKCDYYKIPIIEYENMNHLGKIIGKQERTVISILDEGFAKIINNMLEEKVDL